MTYKESNRYHHTWGSTCSGHEADGTKQWYVRTHWLESISLCNHWATTVFDSFYYCIAFGELHNREEREK